MATYIVLSLAVLAVIAAAAWLWDVRYGRRPTLATLVVLLILTLVFDNLIIMAGIVEYSSDRISEIYLYRAPIEDFAYTIGMVLLIPLLWKLTGKDT